MSESWQTGVEGVFLHPQNILFVPVSCFKDQNKFLCELFSFWTETWIGRIPNSNSSEMLVMRTHDSSGLTIFSSTAQQETHKFPVPVRFFSSPLFPFWSFWICKLLQCQLYTLCEGRGLVSQAPIVLKPKLLGKPNQTHRATTASTQKLISGFKFPLPSWHLVTSFIFLQAKLCI